MVVDEGIAAVNEALEFITGDELVIVADHASNHVPADIELGIDRSLLQNHIAIDIGVAEVSRLLCERINCSALLARVSRLVIDLNREEESAGLLPLSSDGHPIPGNESAVRTERIERFYHPYHAGVEAALSAMARPFILSLHSFTPRLASKPEEARPWDCGILYNDDDRAARIAIPMLTAAGMKVGDQLPYSGRQLNASMNRHAEAHGRPYLGIEMRQDLVGDATGQERFAEILAPVLRACREQLCG